MTFFNISINLVTQFNAEYFLMLLFYQIKIVFNLYFQYLIFKIIKD